MTRGQRRCVELVKSSNECIGDFESTEEVFLPRFQSHDLGTLRRSAGIDPPFAKLIRGSWFAMVVVMSERVMSEPSSEQIRELLDSQSCRSACLSATRL